MRLAWSPIEGAFLVANSRRSAIAHAWSQVPEGERTPVRRRLTIALVDHVREFNAETGQLAPGDDA